MPAIIVAASGGASRAAVWLLSSMRMLDQKTDGKFGRYLFAISGVSGGSLGAVTYLQALRKYPRIEGESAKIVVGLNWEGAQGGLEKFYESDLLVASISTFFLNDALGPIARFIPDRGEALERAFERHWADPNRLAIPEDRAKRGLIQLWQGDPGDPRGMPHFLLNGTDVASGRRLITSTIQFASEDDLFASSDDLLMLLKHDVPASTAVTNSARFPFISPAGRFRTTDGPPRRVVDGGYFENYGARTAAELADKIEQTSREMVDKARRAGQPIKPIVPILVIVSNDAEACKDTDPRDKDGCRSIEEAVVSCEETQSAQTPSPEKRLNQAQQADVERKPRGGGFGPELLAPLLGLIATRGAHGQDALHIIRRDYCPVQAQDGESSAGEAAQKTVTTIDTLRRMIHIALPKPQKGESAPLNWVLNKSAVKFLRAAPEIPFNKRQAEILRNTLQALLGGEAVSREASLVTAGGRKQE